MRDSHILVFDYPATEVTKFILDGTEEFHELSQAFFHHVAWATSSNAMLFDLKAWLSMKKTAFQSLS